ncbi:uncharacterized protein BO66DRAFT_439892 [Aspergillus aculeatinus CBS 121060]|uniref:Uncharacterized protein n=1 Tax=Aspergillus aculeatinus CBS 121060 TaxID=1448322 RepID=A0ACD1H646_9EURO|nr:hypothetical protein BO66DRAFT_439892 [Aspergillus aculeatinus CBS 121060]RAH68886.1 hypothetical protein BO66DRAFT_439892 [Aspergillus aculeatinus CBS 121060]
MRSIKWFSLVSFLPIPAAVYATPFNQHELVGRDVGIGQLPKPSTYDAPRFRWWWPGGWVEPDVVASELQSIAAAGFGGGEIGDVEDSIKVAMDPRIYGWARDRWNAGVLAAYKTAQRLGVYVDMTLGPHWPTGVPGFTPDSPETSKELVHGKFLLAPGQSYAGSLPLPMAKPSGEVTGNPSVNATAKLVAILAARTSATSANQTVVEFEPSSVVDLTTHYHQHQLSWTAPKDGNYMVVAVYGRGTGQIQNMYDGNPNAPKLTYPSPAYIVDHFSTAGVDASVSYWNNHILNDELRQIMKSQGGSIFEDSLELKYKQYWTLNFMEEFKKRRGYSLTPYLFYVLKDTTTFSGNDEVASGVEYDFYSTITDLYIDYRVQGLKRFANGLGLKFRLQPYTATLDSSRAAAAADIPEGESLGFEGDKDAFRVLATGRDVAGRTKILSNELGAYMGKAYGVTWNFLLGTANLDYSLGVSHAVIHGFPYRDAPTSAWPGFAPFTPLGSSSNGFADAWGPRQPQWLFASNASVYMARAHSLLQTGSPSVDVAVLNTDWGVTATWDDTGLNDAGYSYQFPTAELLREYSATVRNKHLLHDGPRYKALLIDNTTYLDLESARQVRSFAESGLPVVIVGDAPSRPQSFCTNCSETKAQIEEIFKSILSLRTTKKVSSQADAPAALKLLGIYPSVRYFTSSNVSTITTRRRISNSESIYFVYSSTALTETVFLEGEGYPLMLNLWTGDVTPIAAFDTAGGYTSVNLSLGENAAKMLYLGNRNPYGLPNLDRYVTATNADVVAQSQNIYLRTSKNGTHTAELSNGKSVSVTFSNVPSPIILSSWILSVEDWSPSIVNETGLNSSLTSKVTLPSIHLNSLKSWTNISGLESASGIGTYKTTVELSLGSSDQSSGETLAVFLNFGDVGGSWGLKINNVQVNGVDFLRSAPLEVTSHVKSGPNDIEITVATTLWNKLRKTWPAIYGSLEAQKVGLLGPVTLTYYAQRQI